MSQPATTLELGGATAKARLADYVALTKPRVVAMVLVTTLAGYYLGAFNFDPFLVLKLLLGTAFAAGGTLALNQYMERDLDARMARTRMRPLPDGRLRPLEALLFGCALSAVGLVYLWLAVNLLTALVTASITAVYLFGYTPMKRVSSFCSVVGAVPGALPPVAGWAAARGSLSLEPWVLFAIMFLWQLPHSLAIAQLYRQDYARAGFKLLPTEDPEGHATGRQIVNNSLALLVVGMLPTMLGFAGAAYFFVAFALGVVQLVYGIKLAVTPKAAGAARRLLFASLVYLPVILLVMMLDRI